MFLLEIKDSRVNQVCKFCTGKAPSWGSRDNICISNGWGEPCRRKPVKLCSVQCFQMDLTRETCQPLLSGLPHLHNIGQHSTKPFGKVHSDSTRPTFIEGQACVHPYLYWALKACRTSPSLLVHHLGRREIMHDRYLENNPNVNLDV